MARRPERDFLRYRSRGDGRALARVFDALAPRLLLVAAHVSPDRAQAEDLVQETFLRAMVSAESYDPSRPLLPWLVGILHNEARKARRAATRTPDGTPAGAAPPDPCRQAEGRELLSRLSEQVDALPETYRDVLNLRLIHGLQPVEIAHCLGRSPSTVSTQLQRGLVRLRRGFPAQALAVLSLAVLSPPARGLDGVRSAVLARLPAESAAPLGILSVGGGILLMKKALLCGVAVLASLALIWSFLPRGARPPEGSGAPSISRSASPVSAPLEERDLAPGTVAGRSPIPDDADGETSLRVRVRWERGGPAPGIAVRLDPRDGRDPRLHGRERRTGTDGTVTFAAVEPGRARISLDRGPQAECDVIAGRQVVVELEVPPGIDLRGRVVDAGGQPVAGAGIWVDPPHRYGESVPVRLLPAATSDGEGRFAISQLHARAAVGARAPGLGHSRILSLPAAPETGEPPELVLRIEGPATDLRGRVVDRHGRPVAGALVALGEREVVNPVRRPDGSWATFWQCFYLRTDASGGFTAPGVPLGTLWLAVESPGHAPFERRLHPGDGREVVIELQDSARVSGTVSDPAGRPIAEAAVLPARRRIDLVTGAERLRTDARGRFELDSLPAGSVRLLAHAAGFERAEVELQTTAGAELEWHPVLTPLPVIRGRVVDETGSPLPGARVFAEVQGRPTGVPVSAEVLLDETLAVTDREGRFSIAVARGRQYRLTLTEAGAVIGIPLTGEPIAGGGDRVFVVAAGLRASARIRGRLQNGAGGPLADAWLQVVHDGTRRAVGRSAASGGFEIGALPPGRYGVLASPRETGVAPITLGPFDLYPDQVLDLGDVRPGPVGQLVFSYTSADGSRIEKLSAHLESVDGSTREVLGAYPEEESRSLLPAGEYRLTVWGTGFADLRERPVTIREGEVTTLRLELEPGVRRELRFPVPAPEDWPAGGEADVVLRRRGVPERLLESRLPVRRPMRYLPALARGDYELEVVLDDGRRWQGSFRIDDLAADQAPLTIPLRPGSLPFRP